MKIFYHTLLFTTLTLFTSIINAQTFEEEYFDGEIWMRVTEDYFNSLSISNPENMDAAEFDLLTERNKTVYDIQRIRQSFHLLKEGDSRRVFRIYFKNHNQIGAFISELENLPEVEYAERVPLLKTTYTPNDLAPAFSQNSQWHLNTINAEGAWDITKGNPNIVIGIVDDAVEMNHPDLSPNSAGGFDVSTTGSSPEPPSGQYSHGTHVAGIAGAATDNNTGVASIGFNTKIYGVKSTSNPQFVTDGYEGIVNAANEGVDIINMSWGGTNQSQTAEGVINDIWNAGIILVGGAGNNGDTRRFYPAAYDNVISVASSTQTDTKSGFSTYGTWIDITAPGSQILSLTPFGNYTRNSGTSMASPLVAGLLGLMKSVNPQMSNSNLIQCLYNTAVDIDSQNPGMSGMLGAGRIDAQSAVECILALSEEPPAPVIVSQQEMICPGDSVQFEAGSDLGLIDAVMWSFPGGKPNNSAEMNPKVSYENYGEYDVTLTAYNNFGDSTVTEVKKVNVSPDAREIVFFEDFEANSLQEVNWTNEHPDNLLTWSIRNVNFAPGGERAAAVRHFYINNSNDLGQRNGLTSRWLDLRGASNVELSFDHAYRRQEAGVTDTLIVRVESPSNNLRADSILGTHYETGQGTFATGARLNTNFVPQGPDDWCGVGNVGADCFSYNLGSFSSSNNVRLNFETVNQNGNNLYIKNIQISSKCVQPLTGVENDNRNLKNTFNLYPNPAKNELKIKGNNNITGITVYDASGRLMKRVSNLNSENISLDISNLTSGYYIVNIESNDYNEIQKLIVQ